MNDARRRREVIRAKALRHRLDRFESEGPDPETVIHKNTPGYCAIVLTKNNLLVHKHLSKSHPTEDIKLMQEKGFWGAAFDVGGEFHPVYVLPFQITHVEIV